MSLDATFLGFEGGYYLARNLHHAHLWLPLKENTTRISIESGMLVHFAMSSLNWAIYNRQFRECMREDDALGNA